MTWLPAGYEALKHVDSMAGNVRVTGSVTTVEQDLVTCRVQGSEARGFYRGNVRVTGSVTPGEQDLVTLQGARF
jgi:glutamate dehydrogenase/leucine dehydrogenase